MGVEKHTRARMELEELAMKSMEYKLAEGTSEEDLEEGDRYYLSDEYKRSVWEGPPGILGAYIDTENSTSRCLSHSQHYYHRAQTQLSSVVGVAAACAACIIDVAAPAEHGPHDRIRVPQCTVVWTADQPAGFNHSLSTPSSAPPRLQDAAV